MAEDGDQGYTWENEYERTWEVLKEDATGSLQASVDDVVHRSKRRKLIDRPLNVRLGMMRHLYLVVDLSQAMEGQDLKPSRLSLTLKLLEKFVEEFFDQNPISQLGIMIMHKKRAEKISELSGNFKKHISCLQKLLQKTCEGEPSIQNTLELASQSLRNMPSHTSREVLIIFGGLSTCDPGDINETIKMVKEQNIRCSIIGLGASVHICQKLCHETQGRYGVILDESHFRELLNQQTVPPPATANAESSLIRMGFPHHETQAASDNKPSMCNCHLDSKSSGTGQGFGRDGYFCPQCLGKYCELPVDCITCGLTLISAPHLSRSYHHLFPLEHFREIPTADMSSIARFCFGCQKYLSDVMAYQCPTCQRIFCVDCDVFMHETLHSCPSCASTRPTEGARLV